MVKANPWGSHQDYMNLVPQHLKENPDVVILGETRNPIVLEEETYFDMVGERKISYGLPQPLETPFFNLRLHVAPVNGVSIKDLLQFKQEVLNDEFPDFRERRSLSIKNQTIVFPGSSYTEKVGTLSVLCPRSKITMKDKNGSIVYSDSFDESQEPYTRDFGIEATVGVSFYPNSEIAKAIVDGTLKWHHEGLPHEEYGYLREELEKFDQSLGIPKGLLKKLFG